MNMYSVVAKQMYVVFLCYIVSETIDQRELFKKCNKLFDTNLEGNQNFEKIFCMTIVKVYNNILLFRKHKFVTSLFQSAIAPKLGNAQSRFLFFL